ncbi:hypothetical protein CsatB_021214 [Cannabis sativa]
MASLGGRGYTIKTLADVSIDHCWNGEIILQIFGTELGNRILNIPRIPSPFKDQIFWKNDRHGKFSVKSAYLVENLWKFGPSKDLWKWIWDAGIHPRVSIMLWRALSEAIPTKNRLHFLPDKSCLICDVEEETGLHLFCKCSYSKSLWFGGKFPIRIEEIPGSNLFCCLESVLPLLSSEASRIEVLSYIGCLFSEIWRQRNALLLCDTPVNPMSALVEIDKCFQDFQFKNLPTIPDIQKSPEFQGGLVAAPHSFPNVDQVNFVIFTDAAWVNGSAGIAAIAVNRLSGCWFVKAQKIQAISALDAELRAINLGLNWAVESDWKEVVLLSDSKIAVDSLTGTKKIPDWKLSSLFYSIFNVMKDLSFVRLFFISRIFNSFADGVAKTARSSSELAVLYQGEGNPPVIPINFLI